MTSYNKTLEDKLALAEGERQKLNERWVRLAAKQRLEERSRSKQRVEEGSSEAMCKQVEMLTRKIDMLERENKFLKQNQAASKSHLKEKELVVGML